jgi:hypothetical protein
MTVLTQTPRWGGVRTGMPPNRAITGWNAVKESQQIPGFHDFPEANFVPAVAPRLRHFPDGYESFASVPWGK